MWDFIPLCSRRTGISKGLPTKVIVNIRIGPPLPAPSSDTLFSGAQRVTSSSDSASSNNSASSGKEGGENGKAKGKVAIVRKILASLTHNSEHYVNAGMLTSSCNVCFGPDGRREASQILVRILKLAESRILQKEEGWEDVSFYSLSLINLFQDWTKAIGVSLCTRKRHKMRKKKRSLL